MKSNIEGFLRVKKTLKSDIFTVLQMVRLPYNQHQVRDFHKMWSIEGVDEIRVKEDEIVIPEVALERENPARAQAPSLLPALAGPGDDQL